MKQADNAALLIVAPNGARASKQDHAALPITPDELAEEALQCAEAGAAMIHMHARDADGKHSLEIADNLAVVEAVRSKVGDQLLIQVTTEAVGMYTPTQQMQLIRELVPEAASFAVRELIPTDADDAAAADFFNWVHKQGTIAQYILYSKSDVKRYLALKEYGVIPNSPHHVLLVLGRYSDSQPSSPDAISPLLEAGLADDASRWAVCAFGIDEYACLNKALQLGGDVRVGFENNRLQPDGSTAANNAQQVAAIAALARDEGRALHTAKSFKSSLMQSAYNNN